MTHTCQPSIRLHEYACCSRLPCMSWVFSGGDPLPAAASSFMWSSRCNSRKIGDSAVDQFTQTKLKATEGTKSCGGDAVRPVYGGGREEGLIDFMLKMRFSRCSNTSLSWWSIFSGAGSLR
ncbi:unnamed protein product [Rhodiola kirilowii]